ncbi:MAG: LptF/LptG family permease [Phycisphaerales bacterium]|nr:LptF/LptG family permease [Phycisphaerales bacterium]
MRILDRHILLRFLGNFFLLFGLLFVFAISIDIIIQWEKFMDVAAALDPPNAAGEKRATTLGVAKVIMGFHGPRIFQFYQYMMPLVALGAMGFTASAMHRSREFTAMLAAGVSLRRAVVPIVGGMTILCALQGANQEFVLPHLAPRLLLEHSDLIRGVVPTWSIALAADSRGSLIHAAKYDPAKRMLTGITIVERTPQGGVARRIEAASATWDSQQRAWILVQGKLGVPSQPNDAPASERPSVFNDQPIASFATDLDPDTLSLRHHRLHAHMLSLKEISELTRTSAVDPGSLRRYAVGRFAALAIAVLVLVICIPFFALREPAPLLRQAVHCAAIGLPLMLTSMVIITVPLSAFTPTVGVMLPVALLIPVAAWRLVAMKT